MKKKILKYWKRNLPYLPRTGHSRPGTDGSKEWRKNWPFFQEFVRSSRDESTYLWTCVGVGVETHLEEVCIQLAGDGPCQQGLSCPRGTVQQATLQQKQQIPIKRFFHVTHSVADPGWGKNPDPRWGKKSGSGMGKKSGPGMNIPNIFSRA